MTDVTDATESSHLPADPIETAVPAVVLTLTRSGRRARASLLLGPLAVFSGVIAVWYLLAWRMLPVVLGQNEPGDGADAIGATAERLRNTLLPYPHDVLSEAFLTWENLQELLAGLWLDVRLSFFGLSISIVLGISFAVAMSQAKWIERSFYPYAVFLQTVPILALVPLIGLFLGFGFGARLLVVVIISLFPIITNTLFGLRSAEKGLHDLFTLHDASRWTRFVKLQLPAATPAMFTGFQISAGLSVIGAIVGDFFFGRGEKGLGNLIQLFVNRLQPEQLWGALFFSTLLGLFVFVVFGWLRTRLTASWYEGTET